MLHPAEALERARRWSTTVELASATTPLTVIDFRDLDRSFRVNNQDAALAALLVDSPAVNVGLIDDALDPAFRELAESCDVLIGDTTSAGAVVDVVDFGLTIDELIAELTASITDSSQASVSLVQLLRLTHDRSITQALHAESLTYAMLQTGETFQRWLSDRSSTSSTGSDGERVVDVERDGSLVTITLQRPDRRNALNVAMRDQLCEALELVDLDTSIDGAILQGAGSNFCAGGDLDEFGSTPSPAMGHHVRTARSLGALMHRLADRVRVHVHGSCVGAGIELPAFCNSVIADPNATFRLPEIGFGLVPGAGGTVSVTRRIGRHRTAMLALTGRTIDAQQALRWHLIDRVAPLRSGRRSSDTV